MQSKGKPILLVVTLLALGGFAAALLHEPKLTQTTVEQPLDAGSFTQ